MTAQPVPDWPTFSRRISAAAESFASGDPTDYLALWAQDDDVVLMGALGGVLVGWPAVMERMRAVSAMVSPGPAVLRQEVVAEYGDTALMCSVRLERFGPRDGGGPESTRRLTLTARDDGAGWRIVHQHSDSLTTASA